jgi:hypothetical protein
MIGTLTGLQWYASRPRCIEIISLSFFDVVKRFIYGAFKGAVGLPTPGAASNEKEAKK